MGGGDSPNTRDEHRWDRHYKMALHAITIFAVRRCVLVFSSRIPAFFSFSDQERDSEGFWEEYFITMQYQFHGKFSKKSKNLTMISPIASIG